MYAIRIFLAAICIIASFTSCRAQSTLPSLNDAKGVESVYISKTLIQLAGKDNLKISGIDGIDSTIAKRISGMEVYSCETKAGIKTGQKAIDDFTASNPSIETLISVNNEDEKVRIYALPDKKSGTYSKIIIYNHELNDDLDIIIINGQFTNSDITQMSKQ